MDFPGGLVVKILSFHWRELSFNPWLGYCTHPLAPTSAAASSKMRTGSCQVSTAHWGDIAQSFSDSPRCPEGPNIIVGGASRESWGSEAI